MTTILNSKHWHSLIEIKEYVEIYINNNNDEKTLNFVVDVSKFKEEDIEIFKTMILKLRDSDCPNLLPMSDILFEESDDGDAFIVECLYPYEKPVSSYFAENPIQETEIKNYISDIVSIYKGALNMELEVELSFDDVSLLRVKNPHLPFGSICVTPYAFIVACVKKIMQEDVCIHKQFAGIFERLNSEMKRATKTQPLTELVSILKNDENALSYIENNQFIKNAKYSTQIQQFDLDSVVPTKILGEGTYGAVIKVADRNGNVFALKQSNEDDTAALYREAFVISCLEHPNIVKFHGFCKHQKSVVDQYVDGVDHAYMLMEFCEYGDLEHYISNYHPEGYIPIETLTLLIGQVIASCFYVHQKRIVHRDLKLANILVKQVQPFPWLKLCDFGFARTNDTVMMTVAGTPFTADPNILKGQGYTDQAELFSMGCIIY